MTLSPASGSGPGGREKGPAGAQGSSFVWGLAHEPCGSHTTGVHHIRWHRRLCSVCWRKRGCRLVWLSFLCPVSWAPHGAPPAPRSEAPLSTHTGTEQKRGRNLRTQCVCVSMRCSQRFHKGRCACFHVDDGF